MKKNLANACSAIAVVLFSLPLPLLAETVPLSLGQPIVVPGTKGRFDYLQVDEKLNRLLAAHTINKTLDIIHHLPTRSQNGSRDAELKRVCAWLSAKVV